MAIMECSKFLEIWCSGTGEETLQNIFLKFIDVFFLEQTRRVNGASKDENTC